MAVQAVNPSCIVKRDYVSRTTRDGAAHGQVFAHTAGISRCLLRTIYRSSAAAATSAVCHIETQYKNLDFTIPDDYVSRREVYAMLDYIGGADADEAFYQGWDAAIDEACSLLNDVDSAIGWTSVEEEPPEESGTLLVTRYNKLTGFREVCVAQYWAVDKRFVVMRAGDVGIDLLDDVVAWMPFPKAYGGKSDE